MKQLEDFEYLFEICHMYDTIHFMNVWRHNGELCLEIDFDVDDETHKVMSILFKVDKYNILNFFIENSTYAELLDSALEIYYIVRQTEAPHYDECIDYKQYFSIEKISNISKLNLRNLDDKFCGFSWFQLHHVNKIIKLLPELKTLMLFS